MFGFCPFLYKTPLAEFTKCLPAIKITEELIENMQTTDSIKESQEMCRDLSDSNCRRDVFVQMFKSIKDVKAMHHKGIEKELRGDRVCVRRLEDGTFLSNLVCTGEDCL